LTFPKLDFPTAIMVALGAGALLLTLRVLMSVNPTTAAPVAQASAVPAVSSAAVPAVSSAAPSAVPSAAPVTPVTGGTDTGYWLPSLASQGLGKSPFGVDADYKIYRNVLDYGAKGDGVTDDTVAINAAVSDGNRCGFQCDSTTTTPAIVYFPPGTYLVSKPIIQYYYTQFIGDANQIPTIKAAAAFEGMAVIDADPYAEGGVNWFTNQNSK
jgi:hypothetical protein